MSDSKAARSALLVLLKQKRLSMSEAERRRRKAPARWLYPWSVENHYAAAYRAWVRPVRDFVRDYLKRNRVAILRGDSLDAVVRQDASAGKSFALMTRSLNSWVAAYISEDEGKKLLSPIYLGLGEIADRVFTFNGQQYDKSINSALGVSFPTDEEWWSDARDLWIERNYEIVRSDIRKYIADINAAAEQAVTNGWSAKALSEAIQELDNSISKSRAAFIARDQIGKLNGTVTQSRMQDIGLSMYKWSSSGDERVRPSHHVMDGLLCRWDDATVYSEDGGKTWKPRPRGAVLLHPGMDYQCRCTALAWFDELIDEADGNTSPLKNDSVIDINTYSKRVLSKREKKSVEDITQVFINSDFFSKAGKKYVDLDGLDPKSAKITYRAFSRVFEKYPMLKGKIYTLKSAVLPEGVFARAEMRGDFRSISLNKLLFKDYSVLKAKYAENVAAGFHPKGTNAISVIYHEIGHCIDDFLSLKGHVYSGREINDVFSEKACEEIFSLTGKTRGDIVSELGSYAKRNDREMFAECFAELMDSSSPSEFALCLGDILEDAFKRRQDNMFVGHKFLTSPYFVDEYNNWHLKPGAPKETRDEFNEMLKEDLVCGMITREYYESHLARE